MIKTPKEQLLEAINPVEFWKKEFPDWQNGSLVPCPLSTKHDRGDENPSLSLGEDGKFKCFGCGFKGTSVIGYYTDVYCNGNFKKALYKLFDIYVHHLHSVTKINALHSSLVAQTKILNKLTAIRGWTEETCKRLRLGWDDKLQRVSIPIFNQVGYCLDIKFHDSILAAPLLNGNRVKMLSVKGAKGGKWFPINPLYNPFSLDKQEVYLVEGEPDAISMYQEGLNVLTLTGGATIWKGIDFNILSALSGKDIVICFHNDKAGEEAAKKLAERLNVIGVNSLKLILPPKGKDLCDFFTRYQGTAEQLKRHTALAEYLFKPRGSTNLNIALHECSNPLYYGKQVKTSILVDGKHSSPYIVPKRMTLVCSGDICPKCPCKNEGVGLFSVSEDDPDILEWLYAKDYSKLIKSSMRLPNSCDMDVRVDEHQSIEQVSMIPSLSNEKFQKENFVSRVGYFTGHGLEANQTYDINAIPLSHPKSKESVLVLTKASSSVDALHNFELTKSEIAHLIEKFSAFKDPLDIINKISKQFSNHTNIYGRKDLHIIVDLCFHSPSRFEIFGVELPKASMEVLIMGDTRCGKGQVAEGLCSFYNLGYIVSGENASLMGLLGGLQKSGDKFTLTWGAIPLNHGRLVIIDEFSGLENGIIGRLSRVRSEGIAEIHKGGILSKTGANTRLIWIANPRKGRDIASFSSGVQAIMDLIETNEDVARFDLAFVVSKGEVDIHEINKISHEKEEEYFTQQELKKIILWAWSRRGEQIIFSDDAQAYILEESVNLSTIYSPSIPLVQGENVRFKLAKIAASIAARCFSTDSNGKLLFIRKEHAIAASKFMQHCYNKPTMGYLQYSRLEERTSDMQNTEDIIKFFSPFPKHVALTIIDGMMSVEKFGVRELQDWTNTDANIAKKFAGVFVRCRAVRQLAGGFYVKKAAFIKMLKALRKKIEKEEVKK